MDIRVWEFTARDGEVRRYEQSRLTIDGEMYLLRFVTDVGERLIKADFPFARLGEIWPDENNLTRVNVPLVGDIVGILSLEAADLLTRGAAILLGIFEFDENRQRNPLYPEEVKFLRSTIGVADIVEMIETFLAQNDIERLRRPFSRLMDQWGTPRVVNLNPPMTPMPPPVTPLDPSTSSWPPDTEASPTSDGTSLGMISTRP